MILEYDAEQCGEDGRGRSWGHCYRFFREHRGYLHRQQVQDDAALHLGFYLASWGMYRTSGFIWKHAYTVHRPIVRALASPDFSDLWERDVGTDPDDINLVKNIMELVRAVRDGYNQQPTDLLVTKILLGTVGCLPACDDRFVKGFRKKKNKYSGVNELFIRRIIEFCIEHRQRLDELRSDGAGLRDGPYPIMKLVDMYFWQIGTREAQVGR